MAGFNDKAAASGRSGGDALGRADLPDLDWPYHQLQPLPRGLWLPGLTTSAGDSGQRLADIHRWLSHLDQGALPALSADFGDAQASGSLRAVVADLGLPPLCRGVPALAEQLLRTLLWHLDRLVDLQPRLSRDQAIAQVRNEFREAWVLQGADLERDLVLLRGLGDLANMRWDSLRGQLSSRPWQAAQRAAGWLAQLPELAALIRRLGRAERDMLPPRPAPQPPLPSAASQMPLRAVLTRLPDAPGEITGIRFSALPERMLASEAVMLRHPVARKLWRARHAEGRLLSWQTEAVLTDWRPDPAGAQHAALPEPLSEPLAHGPIILCLDTSGSMRGAPENIAKAVSIAALRIARETGRACKLIAFGGPGELIERDLGTGPDALAALLDLMGQGFDGGTDVQTPIECAIDRVHEAAWRSADLLIVSDGEFGCVPAMLDRLDEARECFGLRVQGVLVGDRETMGLLEVCDAIHWVRDWRRFADAAERGGGAGGGVNGGVGNAASRGFSPVHSKSLTALYFPNALSSRAARHHQGARTETSTETGSTTSASAITAAGPPAP